MKCPENGNIYSVNHGNFFQYTDNVRKYIDICHEKNPQKTAGLTPSVILAAW